MFSLTKQQGVALVLVLWIVVLLTIMAGAFTLTLQREAKLVANIKDKSSGNALAEAGFYYAMLMLSLNDAQQAWKADRNSHEITMNDAIVSMEVGDERGKIDLNAAQRDLFLKLFNGLKLDADGAARLTGAIIDWRDNDDEEQENGAEKKDYKHKNLPYVPRNAPFQSVEELQFVMGMTPTLFKKLEPMLTIYSQQAAVDITKAPLALRKLLEADAPGGNINTSSAAASTNVNQNNALAANAAGDDAGIADAGGVAGLRVLSIKVNARLANGKGAGLRVLASRGEGSDFRILSWKYVPVQYNTLANENIAMDKPYFN